jgi:hypothetical protein
MTPQKDRLLAVGAMVLAFLASQHHALHMLLLVAGMGGASGSLMTAVPLLRRTMLAMSLAMVGVLVFQMSKAGQPKFLRVMNAASIAVTLGLMAWSIAKFGL